MIDPDRNPLPAGWSRTRNAVPITISKPPHMVYTRDDITHDLENHTGGDHLQTTHYFDPSTIPMSLIPSPVPWRFSLIAVRHLSVARRSANSQARGVQ